MTFDFTVILALAGAYCIGLSKAGFSGVSLLSILVFAEIYGSKASVGLILPLLIAADFMVFPAFMKYGSWRPVWKLLIPALLGIAIGWFTLGSISESHARKIIGLCVLLMVGLQVCRSWQPQRFDLVVKSRFCSSLTGVFGGFATMLANAAGPVIQLYLLAQKIPKMELIGISARFFLVINLIKIPLNARLALITQDSVLENARLLPAVALGILSGKWLVKRVPQSTYEIILIVFAVIAGLRMIFLT